MLAQLSTDVNARVPDLSRQRLVFFLPKLLLTIIICCCCKSNHIPTTTLGCHGNIFGYVEAQAFTYTLVSSKFLRNVLRSRYSHLCTKLWYSTPQVTCTVHQLHTNMNLLTPCRGRAFKLVCTDCTLATYEHDYLLLVKNSR